MSYAEDNLLPISALQHLVFCERQAALIHVERLWEENRLTVEGNLLHAKAHDGKPETLQGERITRGLPLRSFELGLAGQADIVLYRPPAEATGSLVAALRRADPAELTGWKVIPVEYKRGRPKKHEADRVQLAAQALCLEEMHQIAVPEGALYYGQTRRRVSVPIDNKLRDLVRRTTERFREIMEGGITPHAVREKKCDQCSLVGECMPSAMGRRSARDFLRRQLTHQMADTLD